MKIEYVGVKVDGETAFSRETGITWFPGDVNEVPEGIAKRMVQHPDVFAEAGVVQPKKAATAAASSTQEASNVVDPLAGLDDKQVKAFAREKGLAIPGLNVLKGDNLRAKVLAALPK